ncbi:hypothetical protein CI109_100428 [Kwoniella shandongensis]|uniref:non-specific serine/threonine protein kinase n=1 Tax=Kwoniella shandongensis TaxID=1734106 RepID=A0A5M6C3S5_9TREE|nr:uncharacterized protein CI109_001728 [Kwoniella shandongensis]KAA5529788.1 hypothetical protein CI109_001728 [Kwoniella shandongensis]
MYSSTFSPSSSSPYSSPPPPALDPYRASPIQVAPRQPYNSAFSPPPQAPGNFSQMPPAQSQRYQQYPPTHAQQQYTRAPNGQFAYPHQQPPPPLPPSSQHPPPPPQRHKGTLAPGQIIKVGEQSVRIERYLSEGGYAHVYLTTSDKPIYPPTKNGEKKGRWGEKGYTEHCLKRIAFEDESVWVDVKKEIEVMKSLPVNPHLVQYLGSAHSRLPSGTFEVFILMEFVSGGGIIDLLNKRLRDRLKEIEILNIFTDVCEAVAAMHALRQPLLHRDLKIENVLSQPIPVAPTPQRPSPVLFKLCDFGSTTFPADRPPTSKIEADALAMDLNKHTTLQYRSPEMVEPMLGLPVGLPSDVWALGCLLYKLCYYTTPFEEHGPLAIVNAKYTFPPVPSYSPRLQHLIASMLVEQPIRRPTVFEILKTAHEMSGTKPEIDYPTPSRALPASSQQRQQQPKQSSQASNLLDFTSSSSPIDKTPILQPSLASTVQPQRRGRPTREASSKSLSTQAMQSPSQPSHVGSPASIRQPPPRLQITGDRPAPKSDSSPKVDAFGMPMMPSTSSQPVERGFGDSFAASKPTVSTGQARFGAGLPRPPSGIGGSVGVARTPSTSSRSTPKPDQSIAAPRAPATSSSKQPAPVISTSKSPAPSSSAPDGDSSFETRFPSIETLSSSDTFSPPLPETSKPENLISPVTSPPVSRPAFNVRTSMMGNLTGGDLNQSKPPTHISAPINGSVQPRSTQVTGTAFKGAQGGFRSPSPLQHKTDYFGQSVSTQASTSSPIASNISAARSPVPQDLMSEEGSSDLQVPSILPGRSLSPLSAGSVSSSRPLPSPSVPSSARPLPATGHSRSLLPTIDSSKPSSNFMSEQWSPLESMRAKEQSQKKVDVAVDSSDDDEGPENASGPSRRSPSSVRDRSPVKPIPTKSATMAVPAGSSYRPSANRTISGERTRPQSMFSMPSANLVQSVSAFSPPVQEEPAGSSAGRPTHGRKGSITDIVSKYESLHVTKPTSATGSAPTSTSQRQPVNANGLGRKPSVASKPQALRKPSIDTKPASAVQQPSEASAPPTSEPTPKSPMSSSKPKQAPAIVAPKPVRHGATPLPVAEAWSKSSSGRSFPVTKPKPAPMMSSASSASQPLSIGGTNGNNSTSQIDAVARADNVSRGSANASPEKQQPVNMLIQRWNKGEVNNAAANAAKAKRGGYV